MSFMCVQRLLLVFGTTVTHFPSLHPWFFSLQQGSFAFVTVKGGRHEVPETAPGQAFELLTRLIDGTPF